ncbi:IS1/IS1595 family N-terminal zinc-binding domain-containing protein [Fervidobacterium sp.]
MNNPTPSCPKCGSTNFYKNGHDKYGNQQFFCKNCKRTFKLSYSHKRKIFSFPYPKCPSCGKSMQIHKTHRSFVVFRCRTCHTKDRVPFNLPEPASFVSDYFKYFRFLNCLKSFRFVYERQYVLSYCCRFS